MTYPKQVPEGPSDLERLEREKDEAHFAVQQCATEDLRRKWSDSIRRSACRAALIEQSLDSFKDIAARARFELDHPTEMRDTAFSLIEKAARSAIKEIEDLKTELSKSNQ